MRVNNSQERRHREKERGGGKERRRDTKQQQGTRSWVVGKGRWVMYKRQDNTWGIAFSWISVGFSYPKSVNACKIWLLSPSSLNVDISVNIMIYRRPSINRLKSGAKLHFKSIRITLIKFILIYLTLSTFLKYHLGVLFRVELSTVYFLNFILKRIPLLSLTQIILLSIL